MPDPITPGQLRRIHACLRDARVTRRADRLAYYARVTGTEVTSTLDLSKWWAGQVISDLDRAERGEPNLLHVGADQ